MINNKNTDEEIIQSVLNNKTDDFSHIVKRYQQKIYSIGIRFFKNEEDARDFTQDFFVKIFSKLETYKGKAPFKNWLIKIAYNMGISKLKGKKEHIKLIEENTSKEKEVPERLQFNNEIKDILNKAIQTLPENYIICVDLYFFWGLPYKEISKITNVPVNTIKSNILRAKKILYNNLKGTIAEDYNEM
jgi:RNA polymerase sigma-70 factor (ECF subfamily)